MRIFFTVDVLRGMITMVKNFLNKVLPLFKLSGNRVCADFQNNDQQPRCTFYQRQFFDIHAGEDAVQHGLDFGQIQQGKAGI